MQQPSNSQWHFFFHCSSFDLHFILSDRFQIEIHSIQTRLGILYANIHHNAHCTLHIYHIINNCHIRANRQSIECFLFNFLLKQFPFYRFMWTAKETLTACYYEFLSFFFSPYGNRCRSFTVSNVERMIIINQHRLMIRDWISLDSLLMVVVVAFVVDLLILSFTCRWFITIMDWKCNVVHMSSTFSDHSFNNNLLFL